MSNRNMSGNISVHIGLLLGAAWLPVLFLQEFLQQENGLAGERMLILWGLLCICSILSIEDCLEYHISNACVLAGVGTFLLHRFCFSVLHWAQNDSHAGSLLLPVPFRIVGNLFTGALLRILAGILLSGGVFLVASVLGSIRRKKGLTLLGGGDIKLLFLAGLWLGLDRGLTMLFLSCCIGAIFGILRIILSGFSQDSRQAKTDRRGDFLKRIPVIPFGPALSAVFLIMLISSFF